MPDSITLTLGEGHTPLVRSHRIGPVVGLPNLYFKLESLNPTGSYKDRFAAAAVNAMLRSGKRRVIGTSSGNAGAAVAAYCAAAGIQCQIAVVESAPEGKLKQMLAYGAQLRRIRDFGRDPVVSGRVFETLTQAGDSPDTELQITAYCHSPVGMSGVEQISFEIAEQLSQPIDHVFVCSGGGGLLLAVARGFQRAVKQGFLQNGPRMHCVQPEGNNTIAGPLRDGATAAAPCERSMTEISGLQVPSVMDGHEVVMACRKSGGTGFLVSDNLVFQLQSRLAKEEGIFCEPAAAVPLAGALLAHQQGLIAPEETVVCLVTGAGFKDPGAVDRMVAENHCPTITLEEFQRQTI